MLGPDVDLDKSSERNDMNKEVSELIRANDE